MVVGEHLFEQKESDVRVILEFPSVVRILDEARRKELIERYRGSGRSDAGSRGCVYMAFRGHRLHGYWWRGDLPHQSVPECAAPLRSRWDGVRCGCAKARDHRRETLSACQLVAFASFTSTTGCALSYDSAQTHGGLGPVPWREQ